MDGIGPRDGDNNSLQVKILRRSEEDVVRARKLLLQLLDLERLGSYTRRKLYEALAQSFLEPSSLRLVDSGKGFRFHLKAVELGSVYSCYRVG